jgi:hypothetical protein
MFFLRPDWEEEAHYTELMAFSLVGIAELADTVVRPQFYVAHIDDDLTKEILNQMDLTVKIVYEYQEALLNMKLSPAVKKAWNKAMHDKWLSNLVNPI